MFPKEVADGWTLAIGAQDLNGDTLARPLRGQRLRPDRLMMNCSREKPEGRKEWAATRSRARSRSG